MHHLGTAIEKAKAQHQQTLTTLQDGQQRMREIATLLGKSYVIAPPTKEPEVSRCHILSNDQLDEIKELYEAGGVSKASLGHAYGVSNVTIGNILKGVYG